MNNFERYMADIESAFKCRFLNDALNQIGDVAGRRFEGIADFLEWGYEESFDEYPKITGFEKELLENLRPSWYWAARDRNGDLFIFEGKPYKAVTYWNSHPETYMNLSELFDEELFEFIRWEDSEPWALSELMELEVKK